MKWFLLSMVLLVMLALFLSFLTPEAQTFPAFESWVKVFAFLILTITALRLMEL